jgi:hypothetical protein
MINIVLQNIEFKLSLNIHYFFFPKKIKLIKNNELNNITQHDNFIFINEYQHPKINFLNNIDDLINNNIEFSYLSKNDSIYYTSGKNILFENNTINIKKTNKRIIIFDIISNPIDNIIPPPEINVDYLLLLNQKTYDDKINFSIAYKAYEKFLKFQVKDKYCFNFIVYIDNIKSLTLNLPNYDFYRITLFHNFKNEEDLIILNNFCYKNKINSRFYLNKPSIKILNIITKRSVWFEKIVLLMKIEDLNILTIDFLNKYHKYFENIITDNYISFNTFDFISIPYKYEQILEFKYECLFKLIQNYSNDNLQNCYNKKNNKLPLINKEFLETKEKNLLFIRDYNNLVNNIDKQINDNYDINQLGNLIIKKISIGSLCKDEIQLMNEINIIINTINDLDFLNNLVILLINFKNKNLMTKLYIKVIKLSIDRKINPITITCFQNLLTLINDQNSLETILDFIEYINSNNLYDELNINKESIKIILISLFYTITAYNDNKIIIDKFSNIINNFFNFGDLSDIDNILTIENNTKTFSLIHYLIFIKTNFSAYYSSYNEFIIKRNEIKSSIDTLLKKDLPICTLKEITFFPVNNFYLSYQGISSVDIFKLKTRLVRKICPELNYKINIEFNNSTEINNKEFVNNKINICFHSNFLTRWHSVFKDRHQIIKGLSEIKNSSGTEMYNVYFSTFDDLTNEVKYLFGKAKHIKLNNMDLYQIKDKFESLKLDVLVYCEIGMDPKSYFMAFMKLAKVQINTWGHSDTSGIDSIDYFFSSKLYELPYGESQKHYSEKLVLLDSLCTCYINPLLRYNTLKFKDRYEFGFTDEVTIFFCAQSLFKFNPIFDDYIIDILNKNNNYVLILLNNDSKQKIIKRFNNKNITSQIHIFPGMDHLSYLNLIKISDIILDPYPFGGCNSSLEAFSLGKIVITCASDMINGRFTSGFYIKMRLEYLITYNKNDYVELALKFASNKDYRYEIEDTIIKNNHLLFNEKESINDWNIQIKNILKL